MQWQRVRSLTCEMQSVARFTITAVERTAWPMASRGGMGSRAVGGRTGGWCAGKNWTSDLRVWSQ